MNRPPEEVCSEKELLDLSLDREEGVKLGWEEHPELRAVSLAYQDEIA
jgi:hypothetical protein